MGFRFIILSFLLAFCSLLYELIFAKALSVATDNVVLAQTVALGFYFLGMGLGSLKKINTKNPFYFLNIELLLSFTGLIAPFFIYGVFSVIKLYFSNTPPFLILLALTPAPFVTGILTGREFLCLINLGEKSKINVNMILAATYFGNLVAGIVFPLFIYRFMGVFGSSIMGASLNLLAALYIAFLMKKKRSYILSTLLSVLLFIFCFNVETINKILLNLSYSNVSLKSFKFKDLKNTYHYVKSSLPDVDQHRSKYQDIDFSWKNKNDYTLFLNRKPQFSSDNYKSYHLSMVKGFLNLHRDKIGKSLILGGGDGILARYLIEDGAKDITIVDLDPYITKISSRKMSVLKINKNSLSNNAVKVINGDAFSYLLRNTRAYDSIFIDFPLPTHLDLTKLYSKEFYTLVKKHLTPNGGAIFDSPIHFSFTDTREVFKSSSQKIIYSTLEASGINHYTGFGPHENFIYFNKFDEKRTFNYSLLGVDLSGRVFMNLIENHKFLEIQDSNPKFINSIFKPIRFQND